MTKNNFQALRLSL